MAVAESLTGGQLSATIARGADARRWFKGGVAAYQRAGEAVTAVSSAAQLVSEGCACEMPVGAASLLRAVVELAIAGVEDPGPDEGRESK